MSAPSILTHLRPASIRRRGEAPGMSQRADMKLVMECVGDEAELLIAVLLFAENSALALQNKELTAAISDLRPFRSRLLARYLKARAGSDTP